MIFFQEECKNPVFRHTIVVVNKDGDVALKGVPAVGK
jgi:hypothetical protein